MLMLLRDYFFGVIVALLYLFFIIRVLAERWIERIVLPKDMFL